MAKTKNAKDDRPWQVDVLKKVEKQIEKLPGEPIDAQTEFLRLNAMLKVFGPEQPDFINYGRLKNTPKGEEWHHCHLNHKIKNRLPAYVVVWCVYREERIVEINHVDTHENTDYRKFRKKK